MGPPEVSASAYASAHSLGCENTCKCGKKLSFIASQMSIPALPPAIPLAAPAPPHPKPPGPGKCPPDNNNKKDRGVDGLT